MIKSISDFSRSPVLIVSAFVLLAGLASLASSCSSQSQLRSWRDPKYQATGFKKIFVLMRHDDLTLRQQLEEAVVAKFNDSGIDAVSSLQVISATDKRTREQLEMSFDSLGIDAIMIIRQTGETDVQEYVPETTYFNLYENAFNEKQVSRVTEGGYWQTAGIVYSTQTNLFANSTDLLVWQGQSQTAYDGDLESSVGSYASEVINDLIKQGLLAVRPKRAG
ncbi:MAG: hypothetical protein WBP29_04835 [Candidatus Zixiibacteriota bacterium]